MTKIGLPRRIKDDVNGRKRGRVRRRLVVRFYRRFAARYAAWETQQHRDMRAEYDFASMKGGVRGKWVTADD